jgi:hypothetical protein
VASLIRLVISAETEGTMYRLGFAILLAGCKADDDGDPAPPPPGSISLAWTIGAQGCDEAGITDVAVLADGVELAKFPCAGGSGIAEGVTPGSYDVAVRGRDSGNQDRYGAEVGTVSVASDADSPLGNVTLSALPASVSVLWVFDNGMLCAQNNVETVHVRLFDDGDFLGHEGEAACDEGTLVLDDVIGGDWTVDLEGESAVGESNWAGAEGVTVESGMPVEVTVTLSPVSAP